VTARALLLLFTGAPADKQHQVLLDYAGDHAYTAATITNHPGAALQLAVDGLIDVVVAAYEPAGWDAMVILGRIREVGVRVEFVRPVRGRERVALPALIVGMAERGATPEQIGHLLDVPAATVAGHLALAGVR
jgi:hypothetical protein